MVAAKFAALSTLLGSASLVAGHGYVSSILADGQKYVYFIMPNPVNDANRTKLHWLYRRQVCLHE